MKNISKPLFRLLRSSTKIIESEIVKFPKDISSKDGVWKKFLETDSNGASLQNKKKTNKQTKKNKKNEYFRNVNFLILFFS